MSQVATYIEVPPEPWPPLGSSTGAGAPIAKPPSPEGAGVGGGASLGQYGSISHTKPSDIALSALQELESLPYDHDFQYYYDLCCEFHTYLHMCEDKGFKLKAYDTKEGKLKNVSLDYNNRWSPDRRKRLSWKLDRLEAWFELQVDRPVTMISLTSYHDREGIEWQWKEINESRDKLLKLIRKYFGDVDYFWVPEPHKSGYVHYHLAVFADVSNNVKDKRGQGIEDKFRDLWSRKYQTGSHTYGLDFRRMEGKDKITNLKRYLIKYLEKGFLYDKWDVPLLIFNAVIWRTGFRMYGASKRISAILKLPEDKSPDMVWLETTYQDLEVVEGIEEPIQTERVIWARQYIPDWIDSPLWADGYEPNSDVKLYDWGRRYRGLKGYDPTHGRLIQMKKETTTKDLPGEFREEPPEAKPRSADELLAERDRRLRQRGVCIPQYQRA